MKSALLTAEAVDATGADPIDPLVLVSTSAQRRAPGPANHPAPDNRVKTSRQSTPGVGDRLSAIDVATGQIRWRQDARVGTRPSVGQSSFVYERPDGTLVSRRLDDGRRLWSQPPPVTGAVSLGHSIGGGRVFWMQPLLSKGAQGAGPGAGQPGVLWAFDARTGEKLWTRALDTRVGGPVAYGRGVAVPAGSQFVYLLDGATGEPVAEILVQDQAVQFCGQRLRDWPLGATGCLPCVGTDPSDRMFCINPIRGI